MASRWLGGESSPRCGWFYPPWWGVANFFHPGGRRLILSTLGGRRLILSTLGGGRLICNWGGVSSKPTRDPPPQQQVSRPEAVGPSSRSWSSWSRSWWSSSLSRSWWWRKRNHGNTSTTAALWSAHMESSSLLSMTNQGRWLSSSKTTNGSSHRLFQVYKLPPAPHQITNPAEIVERAT